MKMMEVTDLTFISNKLDTGECTGAMFKLGQTADTSSAASFSAMTLKCRQLLFEFPGLVAACPDPDTSSILAVLPAR